LPYEKIGNNEPVCIADEVPFEIPDSWEWCRLGQIVYNRGQMKPIDNFCYIDIGSIDNKNQKLNPSDTIISAEKAPSRARKIVDIGDILYSTVRPYLHNMCIIDREFSCQPIASTGFAALTCHSDYYNEFLFYYLMSPDFDAYANDTDNAKGVAYPAINDDKLYKALIPIPPKEEQTRIVQRFKELRPYIDNYGSKADMLGTLNTEFPNQLKKSILQEAVQGKLVPQDENDEPASVLLDRIRAEKDALIKSGKIKKDKNESIIFRRDNSHYEKFNGVERCIDDEIPFEIPENWTWCRLSEVATVIRGLTFSTSSKEMKDGFSLVLRGGNIDSKTEKLCFVDNIYVDANIIKETQFLQKRDTLIVASSGTKSSVGKSCYIDEDLSNVSFGGFMMTVRPNALVSGEYIAINIKLYRQKIIASTAGYISNITNPILNNLLIPLPPANEQKRIINSINTLISHLQQL